MFLVPGLTSRDFSGLSGDLEIQPGMAPLGRVRSIPRKRGREGEKGGEEKARERKYVREGEEGLEALSVVIRRKGRSWSANNLTNRHLAQRGAGVPAGVSAFLEKNNKQLDHHRDGAQPRKGLVLLIPY